MDRQELLEIIEQAAKTRQRSLDLRHKDIKELPADIGQLKNLTELDLTNNSLSSLPVEIGKLTNLIKLNLSHNHFSSLPPEIGQLTSLKELSLNNNKLSSLHAGIGQLTNLSELVLSYNKLSSLPPEIGKLTNLMTLNLCDNRLSSLPPEIGQLKNLMTLNLRDNRLSSLPPEIGQLMNLTKIYLYNNQLRSLPAEIGKLANLLILNVGVNKLTTLPVEIGQLKNLTILGFHSNQLSSLPAGIGQLKNLEMLYLTANQLTSLPRWILDLDMEIDWVWHLGDEEGIFLSDNPWERPPVEIVKQGKEAIRRWFEDVEKEGEKKLNEVKVLLVGYGGAGKTSLVRRLTTGKFKKNEKKTHGVRITDWKIRADDEDITAHLWDYGGQGIMQATHRVFFSHRSLYVLVIDARQESDPEEWLKNIESMGGKSPVIVVINKTDEHAFGLNEPELERKYPNIKGFYHLSCKSGEGIATFGRALKKQLGQVEMRQIGWPERSARVRERLGRLKKDYITYSDYEEICKSERVFDENRQKELIEILHELGVMLHFPDIGLEDTEVLNPEWATEGIYKIINSKELKKRKGKLPQSRLGYVLNKERLEDNRGRLKQYSLKESGYIVGLMNKFKLCYMLDDGTILVPDLLDEKEPREGLPKKADLRFYFEYDFMPGLVMPQFMVDNYKDIDVNLCWRTGAVLSNDSFGAVAVVRQNKNEGRIYIEVSGEQARDYFATIRKTILEINKSFEKLGFTQWVPLPDVEGYAVKYDDLIGHETKGRSEKFVGELRRGYSVAKLLNGIEDPLERELGRFHLYPPFFEILPGEESFADAWEIFCCDVLNRHENTTEIVRRKAPEGGVDLLWREKKRAYQCKSVIDPATNRFDVGKAVESVRTAFAKRKETGWNTFYICSNVDITGPQEKKLRDACLKVNLKLLTPSFWLPRCCEQYAHLRNRFSELKRPHERF